MGDTCNVKDCTKDSPAFVFFPIKYRAGPREWIDATAHIRLCEGHAVAYQQGRRGGYDIAPPEETQP